MCVHSKDDRLNGHAYFYLSLDSEKSYNLGLPHDFEPSSDFLRSQMVARWQHSRLRDWCSLKYRLYHEAVRKPRIGCLPRRPLLVQPFVNNAVIDQLESHRSHRLANAYG